MIVAVKKQLKWDDLMEKNSEQNREHCHAIV